jgi:hypothetical protein
MATKLNDHKVGSGRTPDGKRVTFDRGQAKSNGEGLPLKTTKVEKE